MVNKQVVRLAKSLPVGLVLLLAIVVALTMSLATWTHSGAQELNKAALVIRFDESKFTSSCVAFEVETISGLELLDKAGLTVSKKVEGMGSLVCEIDNTGCPADDCFCQCSGGGDCIYWSYWSQDENGWKYASLGASQVQITNGDVNGWSWGPGSLTKAIPPPEVPFDSICSEDSGDFAGESSVGQETTIETSKVDLENAALSSEQEADADTLGYLVFGAIVVVLGLLLAFMRRGRSA